MSIIQSKNIGFGTFGIYNSKNIGYGGMGIYYQSAVSILELLAKNCGLISAYKTPAVDGVLIDSIGYETRPSVPAKYILGDDILTANIGLVNEPLTYLNGDTLLDVASSTDGSGLFTFPNGVKVANIKIPSDGSVFYLQEGTGDTIVDSMNGRVVKLSSSPTFVDIYTVESQADNVGYTISNGANYAWDETLLDIVSENVIIPNKNNLESTAYYSDIVLVSNIIVTSDDFIIVTSDDFIITTTG